MTGIDLHPIRFEVPDSAADPEAVSAYVAGVWGNHDPTDPAWHVTAREWITPELHEFLRATARPRAASSVSLRSLVVDVIEVAHQPSTRFLVSLEQISAVDGVTNPELVIVVVELILIHYDTGWRVASLDSL